MASRRPGLFVYRYQGKYYAKYNEYDSFLSGLGTTLASYIPKDPQVFHHWLEETRHIIASFNNDRDPLSGSRDNYFEGLRRYQFKCTSEPPDTIHVWNVEWTYTYDLDNNVFSIEDLTRMGGTVHIRLDKIHQSGSDWVTLLCRDRTGGICRSPYVSGEFYANPDRAELPLVRSKDVKLFHAARPHIIDPSTWMKKSEADYLSLARKVAAVAADGLVAGLYSKFSDTRRLIDNRTFEAFAKELLTCASPAGSTFTFRREKDKSGVPQQTWHGNPLGCTLWFRGRMIMLAHRLDRRDAFESYVGKIIRRVRKRGLKECTAILWSIDHVAVVETSGEKVSCSDAVPFVTAQFRKDKEAFEQSMRLIAHYLPPPCSQGGPQFNSRLPLDVFMQIMDFADPESASRMGRTSKALRFEWLKRPAIGHYALLSSVDGGFLAHDSQKVDKFQVIELGICPTVCTSSEGWERRATYDFNRTLYRRASCRVEECTRRYYFREECANVWYAIATHLEDPRYVGTQVIWRAFSNE